ncbi:hypothetical protein [Nocardia arthritidis]|uniref:Uncharacterized protein n=1 Tax=Nocardia arthritidis TaxID=228602 RepID=A0A6G9YL89_9NOCA|nr:hypothetical protein [Nocardia arthritidis]QIS14065.1 hypothetical protein F5544_31115 [Nocardia arthritidis]
MSNALDVSDAVDAASLTTARVRDRPTHEIARQLDLHPSEIDADKPFDQFGSAAIDQPARYLAGDREAR